MSLVRLSKLMASQGLCSRREADQLIEAGQVFVDGLPITTLGTRVSPTSNVTLARAAQERSKRLVTVILNKPPGYVSGQAERGYLFVGQDQLVGGTWPDNEPAVTMLDWQSGEPNAKCCRSSTRHLLLLLH